MSLPPQKHSASPTPPPPPVDPLDAFTLVLRLFGFLALSALAVTYVIQKRFLFALAFGFVALLIQWRAIALIRRLREDALALLDAAAASAEAEEKAP